MAINHGANILGLVGNMPSGPGIISDHQILDIARFTPPGVDTFLLTQERSTSAILKHVDRTHTKSIQLVDAVETHVYGELRSALPYVNLIQVIHVMDQNSVEEAIALAPWVDALLLDSGNPHLKVKELGGQDEHTTGRLVSVLLTVWIPQFFLRVDCLPITLLKRFQWLSLMV